MTASQERMNWAAPLPDWAHPGCKWTLGSELQPRDTLYNSRIAFPRRLDEEVQPGLWRSTVLASPNGYEKCISNQLVEVEADRWYVARRGEL